MPLTRRQVKAYRSNCPICLLVAFENHEPGFVRYALEALAKLNSDIIPAGRIGPSRFTLQTNHSTQTCLVHEASPAGI